MNFNPLLYLVTDRGHKDGKAFLKTIEQALAGGVTLLQLREKSISSAEYLKLALSVKKITDRFGVPLIINDRCDIALACGAAGVHLGAEDLPVAKAREIMGPGKIIGATSKTIENAKQAEKDGADYLGVGAIFPSPTKNAVRTDADTFKLIASGIKIPAVAIGGLNYDNIDVLKGCGAKGIAVVSAIMDAENPRREAERLKNKIRGLTE